MLQNGPIQACGSPYLGTAQPRDKQKLPSRTSFPFFSFSLRLRAAASDPVRGMEAERESTKRMRAAMVRALPLPRSRSASISLFFLWIDAAASLVGWGPNGMRIHDHPQISSCL
jgi:hypothetical protein